MSGCSAQPPSLRLPPTDFSDAGRPPTAASTSRTISTNSAFIRPRPKGASPQLPPHTRRRRQSANTAAAALYPGAPVTPPPGWAPEPQR